MATLTEHTVIEKIASSKKTDSYLALDRHGKCVTLTYLDREKMTHRYLFRARQEGLPEGEWDAFAKRGVERYEERVKAMVERVRGLHHERVAEMYDYGFDEAKGQLVIMSEYAPGIDLYLATRHLIPVQMLNLFVQVLEGLEFIHQNRLLHLNLKPTRIRVNKYQIPQTLKLVDFGFAQPVGEVSGEPLGTPLYMAPEVVFGRGKEIDERADLFSFGVMMYSCMVDRQPFEHRAKAEGIEELKRAVERDGVVAPPSHFARNVPPELDEMAVKLLARDPGKRGFQDAASLVQFFTSTWPQASREMPRERTSTLIG